MIGLPESSIQNSDEQIVLVNVMEELVKQQVKESVKELGACECETCYLNACAVALNCLMPKYVTTKKGALLSKVTEMELENKTIILVAVTKAVMQVMKYPYH